jgi:hypothetical protein
MYLYLRQQLHFNDGAVSGIRRPTLNKLSPRALVISCKWILPPHVFLVAWMNDALQAPAATNAITYSFKGEVKTFWNVIA